MRSYLARRLGIDPHHSPTGRPAIEWRPTSRPRTVAKNADLLLEGDSVDHLFILIDGWGCRYKSASDGTRQITGFLVPGDICNPEHLHGGLSGYAVGAVTNMTVHACRLDQIATFDRQSDIMRLIWTDAVSMSNRERSWLFNVGQRDATICVGHLLCELIERLDRVGLVDNGRCLFLATQYDIAAATGLSPVHVNRTLSDLRRRGLIASKGRMLTILDLPRLETISMFERVRRSQSF